MSETIHIIGGGISGCAFAYFLSKDFNVILYEKTSELGGLIRTRQSIENIPWQQVPSVLHTNKDWIVDLFSKSVSLQPIDYVVAMDPLFDFRYYNHPFNKASIDTMPWHWKESILLDLEKSNGENAQNIEQLITNFYGNTVYNVFYENYFKRLFGTSNLDIVDWFKGNMRDVHSNFSHYNEKYILFPINTGWNKLFDDFTKNVDVRLNSKVDLSSFSSNDIIISTIDINSFLNLKNKIYSHCSFDIDSTKYKSGSPDTMIYPNHTPFVYMTQFGKFFKKDNYNNDYEKNIIVKTFIDDSDQAIFPIPTKNNFKIYNQHTSGIISHKDKQYENIIFAGRNGSWSFMEMDGIMDQAQKISATIKHNRREK